MNDSSKTRVCLNHSSMTDAKAVVVQWVRKFGGEYLKGDVANAEADGLLAALELAGFTDDGADTIAAQAEKIEALRCVIAHWKQEYDALKAQLADITSDAAVEAAMKAHYDICGFSSDDDVMKASIAAAIQAAT